MSSFVTIKYIFCHRSNIFLYHMYFFVIVQMSSFVTIKCLHMSPLKYISLSLFKCISLSGVQMYFFASVQMYFFVIIKCISVSSSTSSVAPCNTFLHCVFSDVYWKCYCFCDVLSSTSVAPGVGLFVWCFRCILS